jgi:putative NADH-flavin reductase
MSSPTAVPAPTTFPNLVILGASGGIGRHLVEQSLARGHTVTAVVRDPGRLPVRHSRLSVAVADVTMPEELTPLIVGADAVFSALGPRSGEPATQITADGVAAALIAMKAGGVRRILAVSAVPIGPPHGFVGRRLTFPMLWRFFGDGYRGLVRMEEVLAVSGTDWTVVRPPRLTDKPPAGAYRLGWEKALPWMTSLSRADVAGAMLDLLDDPASFGRGAAVG